MCGPGPEVAVYRAVFDAEDLQFHVCPRLECVSGIGFWRIVLVLVLLVVLVCGVLVVLVPQVVYCIVGLRMRVGLFLCIVGRSIVVCLFGGLVLLFCRVDRRRLGIFVAMFCLCRVFCSFD